ncbi:sigma-70 family RNA polymerase sigma factor [Stieleria varia]|uniref:ECF RNA polymerase sigma factor SigW n=1 Tax=Stieleria varia TaxID=2528005 RepID=A0A5C6AS02_9BACT|nr:sigma-70 family RNA polymerase sigma factor [Stieleria varia]TWU02480.1 ECF RNA polymerase sigma factor SigW [Stieleria varia]
MLRLRDRGNHDAWSEFLAIYEPVIYRLAIRRNLQDADASEIVQEVLLRIAQAIDRFDPAADGSFRGWLSQTTRRVAIDRFRRYAQDVKAVGGDSHGVFSELPAPSTIRPQSPTLSLDDSGESEPSIEVEFDNEHREQRFRHAASQVKSMVSHSTWTAFWETSVNDRPADDVAMELGLTVGAVYIAKCRVLKRIRRFIDTATSE